MGEDVSGASGRRGGTGGGNGEDVLEEIAGGAPHKDINSGEELSQFFEAAV